MNLFFLTILWMVSSFDYYMISFQLKYIKGDIYINTAASSFSEVIAYAVGGSMMAYLGIRKSFIISFMVGVLGSLLLIFVNPADVDKIVLAVFVLASKFGVSATFVMVYIVTPAIFPPAYSATVLGICNIFARGISILSPEVAEIPRPVPMLLFCACAFGACLASIGIKTSADPKENASIKL
jgi:OCT family organic cation transporter-like MFS transporter 4/5